MRRARWGLLVLAAAVAAYGPGPVGGDRSPVRAAVPRTPKTLGQLPVSAQEVISRTLGRHGAGYRAVGTRNGWRLRAGDVTASLGRAARVQLRTPQGIARLSLTGYGSGARAQGRVRGNQVSYDLGGVTASYAAGPLGIEQTFRLRQPAAGGGGATLALRLSRGLSVQLAAGHDSAAISDASGHTILRYGGLAVSDARGQRVRSWLSGAGTSLEIRIDDQHARYPLYVDPLIQAGRLVIAGTGEQLGQVAVSDDAVFAGAPDAVTPGNAGGAVFVFTKPADGWGGSVEEAAVLTASNQDSGFGADVAISGSTVAVKSQDAAYVFREPAEGWGGALNESAKLSPSGGGTIGQLAVPAPDTVVLGAGGGGPTAMVFTEPSGGWAGQLHQSATLAASDGATLGQVSLAATPDTIVAGAPEARVGSQKPGAAYLFIRPAGGWSGTLNEAAKLTASDLGSPPPDGFGPNFGEYVAISGDTVVVGDSPSPQVSPEVYVFQRPDTGWHGATESAQLAAPAGVRLMGLLPNSNLRPVITGTDVAVVGATDEAPTKSTEAVFVYTEPQGGWNGKVDPAATLKTGTGYVPLPLQITSEGVAAGGASSPDGQTLVSQTEVDLFNKPAGGWSGVRQPDATLSVPSGSGGEVLLFARPSAGWASAGNSAVLQPSGDVEAARLSALAVSGGTVAVADGAGSVFVFTEPTGGWTTQTQVAQLRATDATADDDFGRSIAISGGTIAVSAAGASIGSNAGAGAVYVFSEPAGGWSGAVAEAARLIASDGSPNAGFGRSIAISGDTIVAGGAQAGSAANGYQFTAGQAYVFAEPPGGWAGTQTQTAILTPSAPGRLWPSPAVATFGSSVAVAGTTGDAGDGVVYVFEKPAGGWSSQSSQTATLAPTDGSLDNSLSMAGTNVFAPGQSTVPCRCSDARVYVFGEPATGWTGTVRPAAQLLSVSSGLGVFAASAANVLVTALSCDRYFDPCTGEALDFAEPAGGWTGSLASTTVIPLTGVDNGNLVPATSNSDVFLASGASVTIDAIQGAAAYTLPRITRHRLTGVARNTPRLSLRVARSADAPGLSSFRVWLPKGLSFTHRRGRLRHGMSVSGAGGRTVHLNRGRLEIGVRGAGPTVTLRFRGGSVNVAKKYRARRHHRVRHRKATAVIEITDAAGNTIPVAVTLRL